MNDNTAEELEIEGTEVDEVIEDGVVEPELDDDGNPIEPEVEAWMQENDSEEEDAEGQPEKKKKLSTKQKLRGKLEDSAAENTELRERIAALEKGSTQAETATPAKRPRPDDYDSDDDYYTALDKWDEDRFTSMESTSQKVNTEKEQATRQAQATETAVDAHYARADELIEKHKINPDTYKASDVAVRSAVEQIFPKNGDAYVDRFIANLGPGSEKVIHYLGINKPAMNEFRAILTDDPTGLKASMFLGRKLEQVSGSKNKLSQARKPAAKIKGDKQPTGNAGKFKKDYDKAEGQEAYNIKKAAKAAGYDTKQW